MHGVESQSGEIVTYDPSVPFPWLAVIFWIVFHGTLGVAAFLFTDKMRLQDPWKMRERRRGKRWMRMETRIAGVLFLVSATLGLVLLCYAAWAKLFGS